MSQIIVIVVQLLCTFATAVDTLLTLYKTLFRIFFIYDGDTVVVLFNAFKKKTQKTPDGEIKKAIKLKEEYYDAKRNQ